MSCIDTKNRNVNNLLLQSSLKVMSTLYVSHFEYFRDLAIATAALALGRLLPTLKSPQVDLSSKVALVTGSNSGIGLEIALQLARQGCTVFLACRNISKAEAAVSHIISQVPASEGFLRSLVLDTSSLESVRSFVTHWNTLNTRIDLLFHNAGISAVPAGQEFSADGFPMIYATNFLGSFLLTYLLEPHLSSDARIILTSSAAQYTCDYTSNFSLGRIVERLEAGFHLPAAAVKSGKTIPDSAAYGQTKGMQVAFAKLLQRYFDRKVVEAGLRNRRVVHASSPGFTFTPIFGKLQENGFFEDPVFWLMRMTNTMVAVDVSQGAATGMYSYLACNDDEGVVGKAAGGAYWDRMTRRISNIDMMSKDTVERLWVRWEVDAGVEWR